PRRAPKFCWPALCRAAQKAYAAAAAALIRPGRHARGTQTAPIARCQPRNPRLAQRATGPKPLVSRRGASIRSIIAGPNGPISQLLVEPTCQRAGESPTYPGGPEQENRL